MISYQTNTMAIPPNPNQEGLDFTKVFEWFLSLLAGVVTLWKLIDKYYETKAKDKKEYIEEVAKAEAKIEIDTALGQMKADIADVKNDIKHYGELIMKLYTNKK